MDQDKFKAKAEVTRHAHLPAATHARNLLGWEGRALIKKVLTKWARRAGVRVEVSQVAAEPPGFVAHAYNAEGLPTHTFAFYFPVHDDRPTAPERADTGGLIRITSMGNTNTPVDCLHKLDDIMGRVAPVGLPELVPAPKKGDPSVMPTPVKVIRNANGKAIGIGDCFDHAKGRSTFGRGDKGTGGLPIKRAKPGKAWMPLGRPHVEGASGAPVPNGYPKKVPQMVWRKS